MSEIRDNTGLDGLFTRTSALEPKSTEQEINLKRSAFEYYYSGRNSIARTSTGCSELDNLLGGGIETKALTQFYGDSGSGKSQICHSLATIVSQNKSDGGINAKCIYVDIEGAFRPERVVEISKARGFNSDLALDNIILYQPLDIRQQELVVERHLPEDLDQSTNKKIKLIIVDSPITHYKVEYTALSEQSLKIQRLFRFMSKLRNIGRLYGVAIVVTNHASTIPDSRLDSELSKKRPSGGNAMGYASTYILYLKSTLRLRYDATLVKSPYKPNRSAVFTVNESGVTNLYVA